MKHLLLASAFALGLAVTTASAVTINVGDVGESGTTAFQGFVDVGNVTTGIGGLTGTLFLKYDGVTNNGLTWNFDYTVTNTSSGNVTASSIGSFGLATTPNATGASSTGLYDLALLNPSFPNVGGVGAGIEVCYSSGNNSCNGNGNTLTEGQSASGTFTLSFSSVLSSLSLDEAYLRFQAINATSPNLNGASGVASTTDVQITPLAVPGPTVGTGLPAVLAGLAMVWLVRRRQDRLAF